MVCEAAPLGFSQGTLRGEKEKDFRAKPWRWEKAAEMPSPADTTHIFVEVIFAHAFHECRIFGGS